jgi:hypothetical protein
MAGVCRCTTFWSPSTRIQVLVRARVSAAEVGSRICERSTMKWEARLIDVRKMTLANDLHTANRSRMRGFIVHIAKRGKVGLVYAVQGSIARTVHLNHMAEPLYLYLAAPLSIGPGLERANFLQMVRQILVKPEARCVAIPGFSLKAMWHGTLLQSATPTRGFFMDSNGIGWRVYHVVPRD